MWNELVVSDKGTYSTSLVDAEQLLQQHTQFITDDGLKQNPAHSKHPHNYMTPKLHKSPIGFRFIAASRDCSLTAISTNISRALRMLEPVLHSMWRKQGNKVGVATKRSWIIPNSEAVLPMLQRINTEQHANKQHSLTGEVWDFSTLYTNIPHAELKARLSTLIHKAFAFKAKHSPAQPNRHIVITADRETDRWTSDNRAQIELENPTEVCVSAARLIAWIIFLIDNIYTTVGDMLMRQIIGIPMGTNCAPMLANFFLFTYEYAYVKLMITEQRYSLAAQLLQDGARFIDDVIGLGITNFGQHLLAMYPQDSLALSQTDGATLVYAPTAKQQNTLTFMDLTITRNAKGLYTRIFDKRDDIPALNTALRFPHPDSRLSAQCKLTVITSQLHRYFVKCTLRDDLVQATVTLLYRMIQAGYSRDAVLRRTRQFGNVLARRRGTAARAWLNNRGIYNRIRSELGQRLQPQQVAWGQ